MLGVVEITVSLRQILGSCPATYLRIPDFGVWNGIDGSCHCRIPFSSVACAWLRIQGRGLPTRTGSNGVPVVPELLGTVPLLFPFVDLDFPPWDVSPLCLSQRFPASAFGELYRFCSNSFAAGNPPLRQAASTFGKINIWVNMHIRYMFVCVLKVLVDVGYGVMPNEACEPGT